MPVVGGSVRVNFLGTTVRGTVRRVDTEARALEVETEDGDTFTFTLNRATATFMVQGSQTGPRLTFDDALTPDDQR
jgi:hypothetical protein